VPRVCIAQIGAAPRRAGEVRVKASPKIRSALWATGRSKTEDGKRIEIEAVRPAKDMLVAR